MARIFHRETPIEHFAKEKQLAVPTQIGDFCLGQEKLWGAADTRLGKLFFGCRASDDLGKPIYGWNIVAARELFARVNPPGTRISDHEITEAIKAARLTMYESEPSLKPLLKQMKEERELRGREVLADVMGENITVQDVRDRRKELYSYLRAGEQSQTFYTQEQVIYTLKNSILERRAREGQHRT